MWLTHLYVYIQKKNQILLDIEKVAYFKTLTFNIINVKHVLFIIVFKVQHRVHI